MSILDMMIVVSILESALEKRTTGLNTLKNGWMIPISLLKSPNRDSSFFSYILPLLLWKQNQFLKKEDIRMNTLLGKTVQGITEGVIIGCFYLSGLALVYKVGDLITRPLIEKIERKNKEEWLEENRNNDPLIVDAISYSIHYEDID